MGGKTLSEMHVEKNAEIEVVKLFNKNTSAKTIYKGYTLFSCAETSRDDGLKLRFVK